MAKSDHMIITEKDHLRTITLETDKIGVIQLAANPSTGYSYQVQKCDPQIVKFLGSKFEKTSDMLGAPEIQKLFFKGVSRGKTNLTLINKRPFENGIIKTFAITIASRGRFRGDIRVDIQD